MNYPAYQEMRGALMDDAMALVIINTFVHRWKDLALAEGRDARIHVKRWQAYFREVDRQALAWAPSSGPSPDALN